MRLIILVLILNVVVGVAQGQTPLQDMVKAEQAFSKMAEEKNTRDAFMAYIADDGLLFRPGAVNGKKWMIEHPVPPSDKKPLLAWQPNFAGMSAAGDMGFTTGPWESKPDRSDPKPSAFGHFVTVWKKQPDGSWKWTVDIGISHPKSGGPQKLWHPKEKKNTPVDDAMGLTVAIKPPLLEKDQKFAEAARTQGLLPAFLSYAAPDIRLYRNGSLPLIGIEAAANVFTSTKGKLTWTPIAADVSASGDLGYTHGTYEITDDSSKVIERGSYVRIWRSESGRAPRVVLDITNVH